MNYKNIRNRIGIFLIFLLWPFGAFLIGVKTFKFIESKYIINLFLILFGLTLYFGVEANDSFRYAEDYKYIASLSFSEFLKSLSLLFLSENSLDIAKTLISFILSRISNNPCLLFGAIAAIFGYFYLKSVTILHEKYLQNKNYNTLFFLLFFTLTINPIFYINGFRFWTAAWIFFFGAYHVIIGHRRKYLLIAFVSILFHFSFIAPFLLLIFYMLIGNRNHWYYIFLIASFFISDIVINIFPQAIALFGEGVSTKAGRYANLESIDQITEHAKWALEQGKWYIYIPGKITFYYLVFAFIYVKHKYKQYIKSKELDNVYSFALLFLAFANTVSFIPSMNRFNAVFYMFAVFYIFCIFIQKSTKKLNWLTILGLFPFFINIIVILRLAFDVTNPFLFTMLPFPFIFDEISIYQWLFN